MTGVWDKQSRDSNTDIPVNFQKCKDYVEVTVFVWNELPRVTGRGCDVKEETVPLVQCLTLPYFRAQGF